MVQFTGGQWPLLETLDLSSTYLSLLGVAQLVAGNWPNLSLLDLQCNEFDKDSDLGDSVLEGHESFVKFITFKWPAVKLLVTEKDKYL